ncbi:MAG: hypothetical protein U9P44_01530 [archaeon]|nr:hypothetical protein [archaeon]
MNENKFLRDAYTGAFDIKEYTAEELSEIDMIDIRCGKSSCSMSLRPEDTYSEFVFGFGYGWDSDSAILKIIEQHLVDEKELHKRISEDDDSVEYFHRFENEETEKNIENLDNALKEIFEIDYIEQTPFQLKKTLLKDKDLMHKIIAKRILNGPKDYLFDFNIRSHNLIYLDSNRLFILLPEEKSDICHALNDFADENNYALKTKTEDEILDDKCIEIRRDKRFEADDVIGLLKKMTYYWEEPWNHFEMPSIDNLVNIESAPYEQETVLDSLYSDKARILAKMLGTLPSRRVQKVLSRFNVNPSSRQAKNTLIVSFEDRGITYSPKVEIVRDRWSTRFKINTDDEKTADKALIALSQALLPEIEQYNKTRRKRYWD